MTVTSVDADLDELTITLIADFDATVERVWELWADPRKLERWWGPPSHPATFVDHDLTAGAHVRYYMTSPEGDKHHGWWKVTAVDPPTSLEFDDGFADDDGEPVPDLPVSRVRMELTEHDGGTRMLLQSRYASREDLQRVVDMGAVEGIREAAGQMDALLTE